MALALMQPDDSKESCAAMASLAKDQDCDFDTTLKGARLRPIQFQSRQCLEQEQHYHSFVGKAATRQWAIGICQKYLVGQHFFWLCDCSAMKEILEYTGNIHQVRQLSQELIRYHFTILHQPARMMQDVNAISQCNDPLIDSYNIKASQLQLDDCTQRPHAYLMQPYFDACTLSIIIPSIIPTIIPSIIPTIIPSILRSNLNEYLVIP